MVAGPVGVFFITSFSPVSYYQQHLIDFQSYLFDINKFTKGVNLSKSLGNIISAKYVSKIAKTSTMSTV